MPPAAAMNDKDYSYCLTSELDLAFKVRISSLEWRVKKQRVDENTVPYSAEKSSPYPDLFVTVQVYAGNQPLTVPLQTSYKSMTTRFVWNEWIELPIKYRDLPLNAQLAFTVWDAVSPRNVGALGADGDELTKTPADNGERDEMDRLEKLMKKLDRGDIVRSEWLDNLAFRQIEKIHKKHAAQSNNMLLHIDLPKFDFPVIFDEHVYKRPPGGNSLSGSVANIVSSNGLPSSIPSPLFIVEDPEIARDNPVENKHRRLVRSHRNGPLDRELKPNPKIRDEIAALTKFLKSVVWTDPAEAKQAVDLLPAWVDIDVDDALELLGSSFENREVRSYAVGQLWRANDDDLLLFLLQLVQGLKFEHIDSNHGESNLAEFLIERSVKNPVLGNYFHWYLMIECEDLTVNKMYVKIVYRFMSAIVSSGIQRRDSLRRQGELIEALANLAKSVKQMREQRPKRYGAIFKHGDDLRQDQLVIQLITLMDDLLRKENLDLKLLPYKVLATGSDHGLVQYVQSFSLAAVLNENNGSLLMFWRKYHLDERSVDTFGIKPEVMDNYVKSCVTYLLGVGDRHLDNLLLSPNGNIFHVDFGFILGRDPKPFPAPMKITKEMVEAMGGVNSVHYQNFRSYCFTAFNILRKSANLILNLFGLMVDANIPDIKAEPDKAVWKVEERFQLDLTEDEAIKFFQNLINESLSAFMPQLAETIHSWAQHWRK
ncbi:Phosphatidylinositol (PI) 3-kinase [Actinomortierella ambigua]|uniref:Phosphatidylinositol 3-kinase VPS34 n=1 Tax=Actinomortierella ambigua TaxID=1343610 RepID=A0A9P6U4C2_9FUNG|nr:Phosphatidylinositol (PI) 3-kinase [Actinomortierella ambigua]